MIDEDKEDIIEKEILRIYIMSELITINDLKRKRRKEIKELKKSISNDMDTL